MDVFPDLATLSTDDLKKLISDLEREENELSYRRRLLHGKIDILRSELSARLRNEGEEALAKGVDVDRLSEILSGKATPPPAA